MTTNLCAARNAADEISWNIRMKTEWPIHVASDAKLYPDCLVVSQVRDGSGRENRETVVLTVEQVKSLYDVVLHRWNDIPHTH